MGAKTDEHMFGYRIIDVPTGHPMQSHNEVRSVSIGRDKSSMISETTVVNRELTQELKGHSRRDHQRLGFPWPSPSTSPLYPLEDDELA